MSLVCGSCGAALTEGARFCSSCGAATAGAPRETRRVVTALFSDVVGSTALGERMDPEDFKDLVGSAVSRMASSVEAFGGEVFEYAGDGLLALFGAPTAHEDDPERAVLAGLRIVEAIDAYRDGEAKRWDVEGLAVRVGIETGLAVLGRVGGGSRLEYGAVGDALNTAARLQAAAEPGTVLVGPRTHDATAERFEYGESRALALKGKAEAVDARPVLAALTAAPRAGAVEADLIGRETELARGVESLSEVLGGSGRILFVTGEAGVGKSRLVAELRRRFEAGDPPGGRPRWFEGRCVSYGESLPYWPFRGLVREWLASASEGEVTAALGAELRRLAPDRADELQPALEAVLGVAGEGVASAAMPPEAAQQRIHDGVAEALERLAAEGPLAISLDDLHWADSSSLALVGRLMELADRAPVLLVVNARPERTHPAWDLRAQALERLPHRAREIPLEALGGDGGRELLEALVGAGTLPPELERRLLERAEGNPFYLEELVRSMVGSGSLRPDDGGWRFDREVPVETPETVEKVVLARIDRLSPPAQELVGVAAVLGRQFPIPLLAAVARSPAGLEGPLRELRAAELVRDAARWPVPFCAFEHTLIQEAAYRGLLKRRRQELHEASVAAIEELYADRLEEFAGMAAHHATAAGDDRRAFDHHRLAAATASRVNALDEATEHAGAALEAARRLGLDPAEAPVRATALLRGGLRLQVGELEGARADLDDALAGAREAGDAEMEVEAAVRLGTYWRARDFDRATELMEMAAETAEGLAPLSRVNALSRLSIQHSNQLRFDRALQLGDRALAIAEAEGDERSTMLAGDALKLVALQTGELDRLDELTGRLIAILRDRPDDVYYLSWALLEAAFVPLARGRFDEAIKGIEAAIEETRRQGGRFQEPLFVDALCWAFRSKGDYDRAIEHGRTASRLAHELGSDEWASWADATLAWALLEADALDDGAACLERGLETAERGAASVQILRCSALLAWARASRGQLDAVEEPRARAGELLDGVRVPPGGAWLFGAHVYVAAARADVALGEPARAARLLEPIAAAAERTGWMEALASASLVVGLARDAEGDSAGAETALRRALEVAEAPGLPGPAEEARRALADRPTASPRGRG